jgi:cation:H+ antiporter
VTLTAILFILGFFILIKGADLLIEGASFIAVKLKLSNWIIGIVIAGIGSSIPEFSITLIANIAGQGDIVMGNLLGGTMVCILLVLGISAVIRPLVAKDVWVKRDMIWNMLSIAIVPTIAFLPIGGAMWEITRIKGGILIALFVIWLGKVIKDGPDDEDINISEYSFTLATAIFMSVAGMLGVIFGGAWVVNGAVEFAKIFNVSEGVIALTVLGLGASLPSLAVSAMAAWKKQPGIAIGSIVGTTVFDFLVIVGTAAVIKPFIFPVSMMVDTILTFIAAVILFLFMITGNKRVLSRKEGIFMILGYVAYVFYLVFVR